MVFFLFVSIIVECCLSTAGKGREGKGRKEGVMNKSRRKGRERLRKGRERMIRENEK